MKSMNIEIETKERLPKYKSRNNFGGGVNFVKFFLAFAISLTLGFIFFRINDSSEVYAGEKQGVGKEDMKYDEASTHKIFDDSISLKSKPGLLHYLYCKRVDSVTDGLEVVMLHGAAFSTKDWKTSGILKGLCDPKKQSMISSVIALDLPVSADGNMLTEVIFSLISEGVLDNRPKILVTPSASGKSMVTLAESIVSSSDQKKELENLQSFMKMWVPVASPAVKSMSADAMKLFLDNEIPIHAIYGSLDAMGSTVSKKLETYAGATVTEIYGHHPCYLDSPEEFMRLIRNDSKTF